MEIASGILMDAFFVAMLVWCAYMDIKTRTISNLSIILLLCLGLAHLLLTLIGAVWWVYPAGLALSAPFFASWLKGHMGGGDVKLLMGIGLYLGLIHTLLAFVLMLPLLGALAIHSWRKARTLRRSIPFAPVLSFGAGGIIIISYLL
jgi:Flp pilus assembly protein protease CpaA